VTLFDENILLWKKLCNFKHGFGSGFGSGSVSEIGSVFAKNAGTGSTYNECGSETLNLFTLQQLDNYVWQIN
jgi:hypothetical protein